MATCQTEVSAEGFDVIRLGNACVSISILPQLGGKISQITDLRTGRDWLWRNPHIALRHPAPGMDYDRELDSGGWDEILFSVKPCDLDLPDGQLLSVGDHGLVVDKAWQSGATGVNEAGDAICELFAEGQAPHFRFQRRIILDAKRSQIDFEYLLSNTGTTPWPWFWCAHPLLAIEDNMHIGLPKGQTISPTQAAATASASDQTWPRLVLDDGESIDLERIFKSSTRPKTFCRKLFVKSAGKVSLSTAGANECFSMMYEPDSLPWLGIWINKKGWSGCGSDTYLNLGIEPGTAPDDYLSEAVNHGRAELLPAGESRNWSLSVHLKNDVNTHD